MSRKGKGRQAQALSAAEERLAARLREAYRLLARCATLQPLRHAARFHARYEPEARTATLLEVYANGVLQLTVRPREQPAELAWLLAHGLLHLGFEHFQAREQPLAWHVACDLAITRFLQNLGTWPRVYGRNDDLSRWSGSEATLYDDFCIAGLPPELTAAGFGSGPALAPDPDDVLDEIWSYGWRQPVDWAAEFAAGVRDGVSEAVEYAAGRIAAPGSERRKRTVARQAMDWFISSYPLLGALAAGFTLVEDPAICQREQIATAAVCPDSREVLVNPGRKLTEEQTRFVLAHELLHVGLAHLPRRRGRDPFLWNVACDFVINGWLVEMAVGEMPPDALYDASLAGLSAEQVYDRMAVDLRRARKLATLRGRGLGDLLERRTPDWWACPDGIDLDRFYRSCLCRGLEYHREKCRGFLPSGLVEEIRALAQPAIPWEVELAQWLDRFFPLPEQRRTYARPSRRQGATPDIPRPRWIAPEESPQRTFGVILDTSGSMDRVDLGKALGAIASYAVSREVPAARVVFCDAAPYDAGYLRVEAIAGRLDVRGRGGTVLQPAIELLEAATDFPPDGPLLILTDGLCDVLKVRREHAFLMSDGGYLPFIPRGPVFRVA